MWRLHSLKSIAFAVGLVAALSGACISSNVAQPAQRTLVGPAYSADNIRRLEINGLRLGMSETEAVQALEAHGFRVRIPEQSEWDWYYYTQDQSRTGSFQFSSTAPRKLEWFTYHTRLSEAERADVAARRAELVRLIGRPTSWTQWVYAGRIADRFVFASGQYAVDQIDSAWSCYVDWQCTQQVDCRPIVRRMNGAVIQGSFGAGGLNLSVNEYATRSQALLQDERFAQRDYSQATCIVLPIH